MIKRAQKNQEIRNKKIMIRNDMGFKGYIADNINKRYYRATLFHK